RFQVQHLEEHKHDGGIDNDQECNHGRISSRAQRLRKGADCCAALSGSMLSWARSSPLVPGAADPDGVMKAQIKASGHTRPPVAMPIQPATLTAEACGCPHFRARRPGSCPKLTIAISATAIRTANTTNAKASKTPNVESMLVHFLGAPTCALRFLIRK